VRRLSETQRALLDELAVGPVGGPALAAELGVSRTAVWKAVEALREAGFGIESTDEGYAVRSVPEYGAAAIEYGLEAPYTVEYHDVLESSNDRARELAAEGAADVAVVADEQTAPRGRLSREWASPPGGVWLSLVFRPQIAPSRAPLFTLATAVAITRAARETGVDAGIKWPNDVLVPGGEAGADDAEPDRDRSGSGEQNPDRSGVSQRDVDRGGRKLAGVLTEMEGEADRVSWIVVGIGLNANVDAGDLPPGATSLRECLGGDVDRRLVAQRLLETFHDLREDPDAIVPAWREDALTLGRRVRVETPGGVVEGEAVDVTDLGALVVATDEGEATVHAGDCQHLRPR
jgi:BirA family biotin operon repressor/biotin-[acetyl-CoA-carboxylase] ligase